MQQSGGRRDDTGKRSSTYKGPGAVMRNKEAGVARVQGPGERMGEEMKKVVGSK